MNFGHEPVDGVRLHTTYCVANIMYQTLREIGARMAHDAPPELFRREIRGFYDEE